MKTKDRYLDTEEACAMPDDKCVKTVDEMANSEQYRKNTEEMHRLADEWKPVYEEVMGLIGQIDVDQEFLDREIEKGGRNDW